MHLPAILAPMKWLFYGVLAALIAWLCIGAIYFEIHTPYRQSGTLQLVEIHRGEGLLAIAHQLKISYIIRSELVFIAYTYGIGASGNLHAGLFWLNSTY